MPPVPVIRQRVGRRCACGATAFVVSRSWGVVAGLPTGETWNYQCPQCGAGFAVPPVGMMTLYALLITGLGTWLLYQAYVLTGRVMSANIFSCIAWLVFSSAAPFWWSTRKRWVQIRQHPLVRPTAER